MKRRICSLLMAFVMLFYLSPVVLAADDDLLTLTIAYYIQGTETKIAPSYKATLPAGSDYNVESPTVVGYKVADDGQQTISGALNENTNLQVYYITESETAKYTINYIGRKIDGTEETPYLHTVTDEALIGEIVTAEDKIFEGYVRDPGNLSLKVTGDGNAVLNVYYTETVNPCIVFSTGGNAVDPITAVAGADISSETAARDELTPTKQGYNFVGWDWNGDGEYDEKNQPLTTMPENDLVIKAIWTPGTSDYLVEYYFQDTEGDGYTRNDGMDEVRQAITESTVTVTDADKQKGETTDQENPFYGFDYSHCVDATVTGNGLAILKLYYDREIWTINLHKTAMRSETTWGEYQKEILPNQDNLEDIWLSFEGRYGSSFPNNFPTAEKLGEYYGSLRPVEWTDYLYVNILWAAQSSWVNGDGTLNDGNEIYTIHNYEYREFTVEDEPGSREINVYPFYAENASVFYIDYYLQDLDDPQNYTLARTRTLTQDKTSTWLNVVDDTEGFTIVGGSYRSKEKEKEWPELGDPPLNYDKTIGVPEGYPSFCPSI